MKRFSVDCDSSECFQGMIEDPFGDYVLYEDVNIVSEENKLNILLEALEKVLKFSITCTSGLDDEFFYPEYEKLLEAHRAYKKP